MKLKGTMVLELTDETTGEVERVEETNMLTNAVNDILGLNAKKKADENPGYLVFDEEGKVVYPVEEKAFEPYMVKVSIENLNIRKGPGTNYPKVGRYTGRGVFTIVEEADGEGASKWGLLKSYQDDKNGWISLDYGKRI